MWASNEMVDGLRVELASGETQRPQVGHGGIVEEHRGVCEPGAFERQEAQRLDAAALEVAVERGQLMAVADVELAKRAGTPAEARFEGIGDIPHLEHTEGVHHR